MYLKTSRWTRRANVCVCVYLCLWSSWNIAGEGSERVIEAGGEEKEISSGSCEKRVGGRAKSERQNDRREKREIMRYIEKERVEGRGDSSERKHRFVIVFVKYYCSDFILTIVFFSCFLLVSSLVGVWKCVCFCFFLRVECNASFVVSYLFCIILLAVCMCFCFRFPPAAIELCVLCVCVCFWWREILFPLFLILFSVCECFVFCSTAVITSFSSFSFIYWY